MALKLSWKTRSSEKRARHSQRISKALKGRHLSDATKQKLSEALRGRKRGPLTKAHREKLRNAWAHADPEKRKARLEKIRLAHTGMKHGPASRARKLKISKALRGKKKSPEHRAALKRAWVLRKQRGERGWWCGKKASKSSRLKMSMSQKHVWKKRSKEEREQQVFAAHRVTAECPKRRNTSIELSVQTCLKNLRVKFIPNKWIGKYNIDMYLPKFRLVIECDGAYWHNLPGCKAKDRRKDKFLRSQGFHVSRISETSIRKNPEKAVLTTLRRFGIPIKRYTQK